MNIAKLLMFSGHNNSTHKSPTEMHRCFVPAGETSSVLTNIDMVHQSITIQETFPCERHNNHQSHINANN